VFRCVWLISGYGTCSRGIPQFYLHTHTFIRNRNEPACNLPIANPVLYRKPLAHLSASAVVIHYEEALYQVHRPLRTDPMTRLNNDVFVGPGVFAVSFPTMDAGLSDKLQLLLVRPQ